MQTGASLLPAICPTDAPPGEKEVFHLLANDPAANRWIALHSLDLADHVAASHGEADFVVLIPNQGIIVVEVKSHNSVFYDDQGWWLGGKHNARSPFKQASEAMHSIRKYLDTYDLSKSVPIVSMVIFPNAPFNFSSPEWHSWQVVDKQALHARAISANLLKAIHSARKFFATKNLSWMKNGVDASSEKLERIAKLLRPRFEILASPSERRKTLFENLRNCTEQQFRLIDESRLNSRLIVTGLAGTGKTTLAIEMVRREKSENQASVVGFFCYNKLLGQFLEEECSLLNGGNRVGTFHSWMLDLSGIKPTREQGIDPTFWNRFLPEQCISRLTAPGMPTGFLDLLVLDESQDLFIDAYFDIFDLLLKGGLKNGRWRFLGDFERQDIYAHGVIELESFYRDRIDERCGIRDLSENCRNTQEISAALTLYARLKPGYSRVLREDSRHDPEILFYESNQDQIGLVLNLVEGYLKEGFKQSDIVLLSPTRHDCLATRILKLPKWKGRLKEFQLNPKTMTYTTIQAFKGLEAPVVILADICRLETPGDFDLLYIGMSRALHRLAVTCHDSTKDEIKKSCQL